MMRSLSSAVLGFLVLAALGCKRSEPDPKPVVLVMPVVPVPSNFMPPAPADAVFYEVNLRAHAPNATFAGVTARLDSIKSLGANVLWLMPIFPVGAARQVPPMGSPYSVRNYTEVNPEFGTLADFRALVDGAHARGMAVVLDWVANHTSWDNPWLAAHPDWYTQVGGTIIYPAGTNWQDVADLNFTSQPMRVEMIQALKYWVTQTNIDGYRCDAADYVPADFWRQALDSLKAVPNRQLILLAEGARRDHFTAGFQLNYGWDFYAQLKRVFGPTQAAAGSLFSIHDAELAGLPAGARKLRFTTNHDETCWDAPPVTLFGGTDGALAASVVTVGLGQTPLVYNGQEVGCDLKLPLFDRSTINWNLNPTMHAQYRRLLHAYRTSPALRTGTLARYQHPDILTFTRTAGTETVLVIVNVRNRTVTYTPPTNLIGTNYTGIFPAATVTAEVSATLSLAPFEARMLRR